MASPQQTIKIEGLRETVASLKALGEDLTPIKTANQEAALRLISAAEPLVPVRTGKLKSTLKASKATTYAEARAGSARVPYAAPIHWGWFVDKNTRRVRGILPQPFYMKALKLTYNEIITNYERNMNEAIKKYNLD